MVDLRDPVELTDRQYREVVAYCSGVVDVDATGDGARRNDPSSVMAVLLRHLRNMLVDPMGARSLKREVRVVRDADGAPSGLEYVPLEDE